MVGDKIRFEFERYVLPAAEENTTSTSQVRREQDSYEESRRFAVGRGIGTTQAEVGAVAQRLEKQLHAARAELLTSVYLSVEVELRTGLLPAELIHIS